MKTTRRWALFGLVAAAPAVKAAKATKAVKKATDEEKTEKLIAAAGKTCTCGYGTCSVSFVNNCPVHGDLWE